MSTAADLVSLRVSIGLADEKLFDVALRLSKVSGHHIVVLHETSNRFVGLIRLIDVIGRTDSGKRILADLVSDAEPVKVRLDESAESIAALFEKYQLGEIVVLAEDDRFVGLITAESVLHWSRQQWQNADSKPLDIRPMSVPRDISTADVLETPFRILLVEDHEPSRSALRNILVRRKFTVIEAGSVLEARTLAAGGQFDLMISDIELPDGDGHDLMSTLRGRSSLVGISVTAHGRLSDVTQSKLAGFSYHFTKPLKIVALLETIQRIAAAKSEKPKLID